MPGTDSPITAAHRWIVGEDRRLVIHVKDDDGVPVNVSTFVLSWMLKRHDYDDDIDAILIKTTSGGVTVSGSYDVNPDVNSQRVYVAIADTDTDSLLPTLYVHELKRMDAGLEGVLVGPSKARLMRGVHKS